MSESADNTGKTAGIDFPNEIWIEILEIFLIDISNFRDFFKLRRTCKKWNELIPIVINDIFSLIFSGEWSIEVLLPDPGRLSTLFIKCPVTPIYDSSTNLIRLVDLKLMQTEVLQSDYHSQVNVNFSKYSSLIFTSKYAMKDGKRIGKRKTYYFKMTKDNLGKLMYWKIVPNIWFDGLEEYRGRYFLY
ncbi:9788_t:CDS:2 [Acaulospora colombiana]|uniref:9788_t:CDS:1 n=1 Tax=Acaulospora colombiana TaxID=27376 RepID=A0ACA9KWT7_9GLOM|nr:9788_t:CDS:2 [Acaulospora colombiana]